MDASSSSAFLDVFDTAHRDVALRFAPLSRIIITAVNFKNSAMLIDVASQILLFLVEQNYMMRKRSHLSQGYHDIVMKPLLHLAKFIDSLLDVCSSTSSEENRRALLQNLMEQFVTQATLSKSDIYDYRLALKNPFYPKRDGCAIFPMFTCDGFQYIRIGEYQLARDIILVQDNLKVYEHILSQYDALRKDYEGKQMPLEALEKVVVYQVMMTVLLDMVFAYVQHLSLRDQMVDYWFTQESDSEGISWNDEMKNYETIRQRLFIKSLFMEDFDPRQMPYDPEQESPCIASQDFNAKLGDIIDDGPGHLGNLTTSSGNNSRTSTPTSSHSCDADSDFCDPKTPFQSEVDQDESASESSFDSSCTSSAHERQDFSSVRVEEGVLHWDDCETNPENDKCSDRIVENTSDQIVQESTSTHASESSSESNTESDLSMVGGFMHNLQARLTFSRLSSEERAAKINTLLLRLKARVQHVQNMMEQHSNMLDNGNEIAHQRKQLIKTTLENIELRLQRFHQEMDQHNRLRMNFFCRGFIGFVLGFIFITLIQYHIGSNLFPQ